MPSKRSICLFGLMLLFLPTQVYGATLQYASGGFAVTPYIYAGVKEDSCGIYDPPIIGIYNPGPQVGINKLSGSKNLNITSGCPDEGGEVRNLVSWNLQAAYGKKFSVSSETYNSMDQFFAVTPSGSRNFIRMDTQDGLFLRVTPEAGEKIGQTVKLNFTYNIGTGIGMVKYGGIMDNDPLNLMFESADSQPNRITVNNVPKYTFLPIQVGNACSSGNCYTLTDNPSFLQFHFESHDGHWPYQYQGDCPESPIEALPGELNQCPAGALLYAVFDYPITCKIGDLIGLDLGYFQEVSDQGSIAHGYPEIFTKFDFSLTAQVVPVPGSVLLLGNGLLLLAGVRARRRS